MSRGSDPYENLANSIVLSAVKDYREANKKLTRGRKNTESQRTHDECLEFFRSKWFSILTSVDPEFLIQKLDEEVRHDG